MKTFVCILSVFLSCASAGILNGAHSGYEYPAPAPLHLSPVAPLASLEAPLVGPPQASVLSQPILAAPPQQIFSATPPQQIFSAAPPQHIFSAAPHPFAPAHQVYSAPPQEIKIVVQEPQHHLVHAPAPVAPLVAAPEVRIVKIIRQLAPPPVELLAPQPQHIKIIKFVGQHGPAPGARVIRVFEDHPYGPRSQQLIKVINVHDGPSAHSHLHSHSYSHSDSFAHSLAHSDSFAHSLAHSHSHAHSHGPVRIIKVINGGNDGWNNGGW